MKSSRFTFLLPVRPLVDDDDQNGAEKREDAEYHTKKEGLGQVLVVIKYEGSDERIGRGR